MVSDQRKPSAAEAKQRDELLLRLLKTPPQPRPKREGREKPKPNHQQKPRPQSSGR